jgi:pyrroline-5-carboxylate reductase
MANKKIAFIGPGAMAEAMIAGLLRQKLASPKSIAIQKSFFQKPLGT